ncbi:MAG: ATP-binding protein [Sulfuritalea sp.]|nr:ATP-binding protein [Sulfuritalea sp.]MDP1985328.1 ATP-binding protein [Sulfuritalea sp.]
MDAKTLLFGKENRIGRRLIVLVIAFSSLITLCVSVVQLALEYRGLRGAMDRQLDSIAIYVPTIAGSVWDFDEKQIQRALDALALLPDVVAVRVTAANSASQWTAGKSASPNTVTRSFSLRHEHRGADTEIGKLELVASLDGIYAQVKTSAISILVSNALKTFLVVIFMVVLIRRLITIRLERMAHKVRVLIPGMLPLRQLVESEPQPIPPVLDELDAVDWALDRTTDDLHIAVSALQDSNARLDQTVRERTQELEAAIAELKSFSYAISHDMKAPLRAMSGYCQILHEDFAEQLGPEGEQVASRIVAATERMDLLINDTLGLYSVSASTFKQESVDLTGIARAVAGQFAQLDPGRSIEWHIDEGMRTDGDAGLLRTALENLIGNAWKYSGKRDVAQISIGMQTQNDGGVVYYVRDNGAGFDMAYADTLFMPFKRLHHAADFPGSGVGLATVRKIISRHNGRVWAEAAVGLGASFYFTLNEAAPGAGEQDAAVP